MRNRAYAFLFGVAVLLASIAASADVIFGPQSFVIRGGTREYGPAVVQPKTTAITITLSRENWPAAGIDIEILVSFDGGNTYLSPGPTHIDRFVATPKEPNVLDSPASIGVGWNEEIRQATHAKVRTINPSGNFNSTVSIDALLAP